MIQDEAASAYDSFEAFPKIPRLFRDMIVTEKLDGTNAQVIIDDEGRVRAASRNRFITPSADNFGFARWVEENAWELRELGPGRHYGEWWGNGIQRGYGLPKDDRRFSLFNVSRWQENSMRPACCGVVPTLFCGPFSEATIHGLVSTLRIVGSQAVPGFMNPEGVVIFHAASRQLFKVTCEDDEKAKGAA